MSEEHTLSPKAVDAVRDRILANQYFIFNNPDDEDVKALKEAYITFRKSPDVGTFVLIEVALIHIEEKREPK